MGPLDDYLAVLTGDGQGDGWIEVRYRHPGGMRTRFYPARSPSGPLVRCVTRRAAISDVYIGCTLRATQRGGRDAFGEAWTLWAECDSPAASERAQAFDPAPTLVIASGTPGNVHAYWALAEPIYDADELEDANRRLASTIGADLACCDAARILRPPATYNHKHRPPRPVRQLASDAAGVFLFDDVIQGLPLPEPVSAPQVGDRTDDDPLLAIEPARYVAVLTGKPIGRDHKVRCPFHEDRTPSLHVYESPDRGWYCFGCRVGGSIYDLAFRLWNLEPRGREFVEVRRRLRVLLLD